MTLEDKLKFSDILSQEEKSLKSVGILNKKQRKRSWIIFACLLIYTIITQIILNITNISSHPLQAILDPVFFLTFLNLIILVILKATGKSTTALNHIQLNRFLIFLNKFCKVGIFCFTTRAYFIYFQMILPEHYHVTISEAIKLFLNDGEHAKNLFLNILYSDLKLTGFLLSIALSISSIVYVLVVILKILFHFIITYWLSCFIVVIPVINLIYFIQKIRSDEGTHFKHYRLNEEENMVIVEYRKIYPDVFREEAILKRFLSNSPFLAYSIIYDLIIVVAIVMFCMYC